MRRLCLLTCVALPLGATPGLAQKAYPVSIPTPKGEADPSYQQLSVSARDSTKLVVHEWAPPKPAAGKPVIVFLHGIGMHGEPYAAVAAGFTCRGLTFVVPDLRGHGRSGGDRGQLPPPHVLRADLGAVIGLVNQRHPGAAVVLAGDSMGGLMAADYAWRGERPLAGLVLLVPAFAVHPSQVKLGDIGDLIGKGQVNLDSDEKLKPCTRVPDFITAKRADKLALANVQPEYLLTLAGLQVDLGKAEAAAEIRLPLFIVVAGKDRIVDNTVTKKFYDRVATPKEARTWKQYDDAHHTLCWDSVTPEMVAELAAWAVKCARMTEKAKE
jgi:alpha-beta hydrolase superfamily lysophospholipase